MTRTDLHYMLRRLSPTGDFIDKHPDVREHRACDTVTVEGVMGWEFPVWEVLMYGRADGQVSR